MPRAKIVRDSEGRFYGIKILCPGCTYSSGQPMPKVLPVHWLPFGEQESPHQQGKDHWSFNGDFDLPVFGPSINEWWGGDGVGEDHIPLHRCHSFIGCNGAAPGQIIYLGDCTHKLAGQVRDLPEIPREHNG